MKPMKKLLSLGTAVLLILGSAAACGTDPNSSQQSTVQPATATKYEVETLKEEGGTDWGVPNPYLHASRGPGTAKMRLVFGSLLEADEKGPTTWLAKSWSQESGNYTFTLYPDAKFHDGTPLTTADVAFTIDYSKKHPPVSASLGAGDKFIVDSYKIVDDQTITITVKDPIATTLTSLGSFVILPKHIWEKVEDPASFNEPDAFIGSGAYKLESYDGATGTYSFAAFDDFCGGKPAAGKIQFVPVSDSILAFENKEIDITAMPADLRSKYESDPAIGVVEKENDTGYKLLVNFEKKPEFLDINLRKALYQAIDRQTIVDRVFRGAGTVGSAGYAPPGSIYYNDQVETYAYDPDAAKAVFAGKNFKIDLLAANSGDDVNIAELLKVNLEQAGFTVNVVSYDSQVRDDKVNAGDYEFALVGNGGWGGKAPEYLRTIFSDTSKNKGGNPHSMGPIGYSNAKITELAEGQRKELDFDKRVQMFKDLQMEISKEIPLIVVANQSSYSMYRKDYYDGWMKTYDYQQAEQNRLSYMTRS